MNAQKKSSVNEPGSFSGRTFIIVLVTVILVFWGLLWLGFQSWRTAYEQRAVAGRKVAKMIRPLVASRPESIRPAEWEDTVDHVEAMLIAVTGSNLLNNAQLDELGHQVSQIVEQSAKQPEQGPQLLKGLWDDLSRRAGPVADMYGRPECVLRIGRK